MSEQVECLEMSYEGSSNTLVCSVEDGRLPGEMKAELNVLASDANAGRKVTIEKTERPRKELKDMDDFRGW